MHIAYLYQPGRLMRLEGVKGGEAPTEFFYGAPELEKRGHTLKYIEVHDVAAEMPLRIFLESVTSKKLLPAKVHFALLDGVRKVLLELQNVDVVVATTPGIAFSLAILKSLTFSSVKLPFELIAIHCGVLNYPQGGFRRIWSRILFKKMWTMLYGQGELASMMAVFTIPANRIVVNCFGVDENYWTQGDSDVSGDYVLSIGNDSNRDYSTLLKAATGIKKEIRIITRQRLPEHLPDNVNLDYGSWHTQALSDDELRELYRRALCVIVPLQDSIQPSGQSVTLQAMACGIPVILTKTGGLWELDGLRDKKNVLFVNPNRPEELVTAVELLSSNSQMRADLGCNGRKYVMQYGRIKQFADRMETYCEQVIESKNNSVNNE